MAEPSSHIKTGVDRLLDYVRAEGDVGLAEASKTLGVDKEVVLGWAHALDDSGFIDIHHSARRGRVLIAREPEEDGEDLKEVRKETAEDIQRVERLREEKTEIEQFRDILARTERALEEDEEEAEDLEDLLEGENLETLHEYLDEVREAETGVERMEERLDSIAARLEALRMVAEERERDGQEEEDSLPRRLLYLLPWKEKTFKCGECGKEFGSRRGRDTHRGMVHGD